MAIASPESVTDMSEMNTEAVASDATEYIDFILGNVQANSDVITILHALKDSLATCVDVVP